MSGEMPADPELSGPDGPNVQAPRQSYVKIVVWRLKHQLGSARIGEAG